MRLPFKATCADVASWRNDQTDWKQAFAKFNNFSRLNHLGGTAPECPPVAAGLDQEPVPGRESTKYTLVEKQLAF